MMLESAEPRDVHHFATLLGYGAQAINPYLAQECVEELVALGLLDKDPAAAVDDYNGAILHGIVKIASKMGISTIQSYQSAQIFECVGINRQVIDKYFTNTVSRVGGVGLERSARAWSGTTTRPSIPWAWAMTPPWTPPGPTSSAPAPTRRTTCTTPGPSCCCRKRPGRAATRPSRSIPPWWTSLPSPTPSGGVLDFRFDESGGISIEEVEPVESIVRRFKTGAMSYGSISQEAHECMAIAMNRIGGKSNSGEGGEARARLGDERCSAIKQVASGRFGVTSEYLCERPGDPDQDGSGCQARRGRPPAREEGLSLDRQDPVLHPRRQR